MNGLIPGPTETAEQFEKRANRCVIQKEVDLQALNRVEALFGVRPEWIEVESNRRGLMPWEPAATWVEESESGEIAYRIQVHPRAWYPKEEVIAHEMVHAMRMAFSERQFEEVLAYQTSRSGLRRYLGPLFANPAETKILLLLLFLPWIGVVVDLFWTLGFAAELMIWIPIAALTFLFSRLVCIQRTFAKCLLQIEKVTGGSPLRMALWLTDAEIRLFSRSTLQEISSYIDSQRISSLRWQMMTN